MLWCGRAVCPSTTHTHTHTLTRKEKVSVWRCWALVLLFSPPSPTPLSLSSHCGCALVSTCRISILLGHVFVGLYLFFPLGAPVLCACTQACGHALSLSLCLPACVCMICTRAECILCVLCVCICVYMYIYIYIYVCVGGWVSVCLGQQFACTLTLRFACIGGCGVQGGRMSLTTRLLLPGDIFHFLREYGVVEDSPPSAPTLPSHMAQDGDTSHRSSMDPSPVHLLSFLHLILLPVVAPHLFFLMCLPRT